MKHNQVRKNIRKVKVISMAIRFFMAAALTGNQVRGGYAPFALGCVAAAGAGANGIAALLGTLAGAILFLSFVDTLPFLATGILIFTAVSAFRESSFLARPQALAITSSFLFLSVSLIYVTHSIQVEVLPCLAAAGLTGASAWFFHPLLHPTEKRNPSEGILFLSAALLLSIPEISGVSLGRILLYILLAWTAYEHGAKTGAAIGLGIGLTADLCAESGNAIFTAAMGLAGFLCGRCKGRRYRAALFFFLGIFAAALADRTAAQILLIESGISMLFFALLPKKLFNTKHEGKKETVKISIETESLGIKSAGNMIKERLNRAAAALRDIYNSMGRETTSEENPAIIFDRTAEKICQECALCELCWHKEYAGTFNALNEAAPLLLERGYAIVNDFPNWFLTRCIHMSEFLTTVNTELSAFFLRRRYRRQLEETRRNAQGQYEQLSELLTAAAAGVEEAAPVFHPEQQKNTFRVGVALRARRGENVCGDTILSFQTDSGLLCLLLADGMGSGESAHKESALTCRLLRQFLEADIHPEAALKTLNAAMALRGEQTGSFTTVDLCTFDTLNGETTFYKYGAAPSYLKKGDKVRRVTGTSFPVGLRSAPAFPDITRLRLEGGCFAVMVSDGVTDPAQDEWLQALLSNWKGDDPQELASAILKESIRRRGLQDDCGIQILYRPRINIRKS